MSEEALRLIHKEKKEKTGELDLGYCGLTEIPKEVFELTHLRSLILSNSWWDEEKQAWISGENKGDLNTIEFIPDAIAELQNLEWLISAGSQGNNWPIKDIGILKRLKKLKKLDIGFNTIQDISPIGELTELEILNVYKTRIQDLTPLSGLKSLTSLDLSSNQILNANLLSELTNLTSLDLDSTQIQDIKSISGLSALTSLILSNNQIQDRKPISELTKLASLDLSNNQIQDIKPISELTKLASLDLSNNQIQDIKPISGFTELTTLSLSNNQIQDLTPISGLTELTTLDLNSNQIQDIKPISELIVLTRLGLSINQIQDIKPISKLTNLTSLGLSNNQIQDIKPISKLTNLTSLDLHSNQIQDLKILTGFTALNSLYLSDNQIQDLEPISGLTALMSLDLINNQIQDIRHLLPLIHERIKISAVGYVIGLNLRDNPITTPPIEIVNQGNDAIINYFESLDRSEASGEGPGSLKELKLILVGEGASGKTSLLKQLEGKAFDPKESQTHGINIARMSLKELPDFEKMEGLEDVVLHGWDFGGQEIMHASHQIFLTKRAIYIYVIDSRNDAKKDYWLQHIQRYGDGSPSLVAINKTDLNPNYDLERGTLNKKYPFLGQRFYRVSCKEGTGLAELKEAIGKLIPNTELYEMKVPGSWVKVKNALEQATDEQNYLSRKQFLKLCKDHGVEKTKEQNTLLQFLHDLGLVFHFADLKLANFYVLDPHWVTVAVYKIMNTRQVSDGILKEEQLDLIINHEALEEQYDPADKEFTYKPEELRYIVEIMAEFELLYQIGKGQYLIPDLLPKETETSYQVPEEENIHFVLEYDFLSQSLFNRLVIARQKDIKDRTWLARNQVVLNNDTCTCAAFIQFDLDAKRMDIRVWGEDKRQYLAILRDELNNIHQDFHGLKVEQKLPIPESDKFLDYDELIGLERMGQTEVSVGVLGKTFRIADFLDPIATREERLSLQDSEKEDMPRNIKIVNKIENKPHNELKAKLESTVTVSIQIQNLRDETELLKEDIESERVLLEKKVDKDEIDVAISDIEKTEKAIAEIETASQNQQPVAQKSKSRLSRFIEDLSDKESPTHKTLKALRKGKDYAVNLAEMYNGVASNIGMPNVPPAVLGLLKKL